MTFTRNRRRSVGTASLLVGLAVFVLPDRADAAPPTRRSRAATRPAPTSEGPDVSFGYSYLRAGEAGLHGLQLTGSRAFRNWRLVADVSYHVGDFAGADLSQLDAFVGVRRAWPGSGRLHPYAQVLVGLARHSTSVTLADGGSLSASGIDPALAPGGGLDWRLNRQWDVRAGLDLLTLRAEGDWDVDPRFSVGVVYRLSR